MNDWLSTLHFRCELPGKFQLGGPVVMLSSLELHARHDDDNILTLQHAHWHTGEKSREQSNCLSLFLNSVFAIYFCAVWHL